MTLLDDAVSLQGKPWLRSRLSFGATTRMESFKLLLEVLQKYEAKPVDVMQLYADEITWPIPARYSELPYQENYLPRLPVVLKPKQLQSLFNECLALVIKNGYTGKAPQLMQAVFGSFAFNPLLFSVHKGGDFAGRLFCVEFALAISHHRGRVSVEGDGCYMRLWGIKGTTLPLGLYNKASKYKRPEWLRYLLFEPRGFLKYDTFDTIDRLKLWSESNLKGAEKAEFEHILFTLKATSSVSISRRVDKLVRKFELDFEDTEIVDPFQAMLYTDEALEQVKDIWLEGEGPSYQTYREMYDYLVPTYFDSKQWKELFQVGDMKEAAFTFAHVEMIDSRFDVFTAFFNKTKAKIERKK